MTALLYLFIVLFILVSLLMVLIVLIQKGRGGGLSGAFGGAGGHTAFGSKTGDVLTWATSIIFGVFLALAIVLNLLSTHRENQRVKDLQAPTPPAQQMPVQQQ
jgi:preprotein translocase subunit SecG